ncbi:conserved hypothetical protein [Deferribacter desulfuricans SSM1]|uniref:Phosphatidic acid phosphatase type 2/haloperoxidase domain-containing protein n=1 Tax=Deferribacter desulfuricans (strain DSM 14783 / JCM 11476 / NBRC 101012 / SSM1) TaxID=639282 RepID=D3PC80_DEFDS|nr:undecaprenyl-diphosphatase [Deferribacter desulfuricans]BAI80203.1 conserved hypothetical protein [Deferribacter desulfuricans SSM1]
MENVNVKLFLLINSLSGNKILDHIFINIANYSPYFYILIILYCYFFNDKDKAYFIFYSACLGLLLNFIITLFYYHPRPFELGIGHTLIHHSLETSFPSDHATLVFSISIALVIFGIVFEGIILFMLAIVVGFSRVYVGAHFPFDILGSFIVSVISTTIIFKLQHKLYKINLFLDKIVSLIIKRIPYINKL